MTTYEGTSDFEGATFVKASFKGATLRFSDVRGVTMRSVDVDGLDIDSHDLFMGSLVVNGVDVVPLVDAELNRQFPGRELQAATDAWLRGAILRIEQPFHEIGQVFTGADEMGFDTSIFRAEPPGFDEVLVVRGERQQMVTDFLATVTAELLAEEREDPWGGDWRPSVGDCIRVVLEEEWAHLRYVRRDLARLR